MHTESLVETEVPDLTPLLREFKSGSLTLRNRFALAPMTRLKSPEGIPTDLDADYYRRRAAGGAGLIITEGVHVRDPAAGFSLSAPHMYGEQAAQGWRKVTDAVHQQGSAIIAQLWHMGAMRGEEYDRGADHATVSPSGVGVGGERVGRELTTRDIDRVISDFVESAKVAKASQFDGVELHGGHGYIFDQFFWPITNRRSDRFGHARSRGTAFACEVVQAIREEVGPDFSVVFRFSQWKSDHYGAKIAETPTELAEILEPLATAGVDIFHPSTRRHWQPEFESEGSLGLAGWTKKITGLPVIAVGSVGVGSLLGSDHVTVNETTNNRLEILLEQFDRGEFDIIAIGRALLADSAWINKMLAGTPEKVKPYVRPPRGERLY